MLSTAAGKSKDRLAARALAVNVSFSVAEFISYELEKITEFFVLSAACGNVPREHSERYPDDKCRRCHPIEKTEKNRTAEE